MIALLAAISLLSGNSPAAAPNPQSAIRPDKPGSALRSDNPKSYALGVGLEGVGGRGLEFVDAMKTSRHFEGPNGGSVKVDAHGWPLEDARTVVFDLRPAFAWAPPMDDPDAYLIDVSGTYHLSFEGRADLSSGEDPRSFQIQNNRYDAAKNLTTAELVLPKGHGLMILKFTRTQGGVRNVRVIRPGYPADTKEVFHRPFVKAAGLFPVLRFMDWLDSNSTNPFYGDAKNTTEWANRKLPEDASQSDMPTRHGVAWEYVVQLANLTGKDAWINVPIAASDDYVKQLATMLKRDLKPGIKIYLELNNEVWNWGFLQATYNRMAAEAEVAKGTSNLNNDGAKDKDLWRRRRYAKRTIEIGQIFASVFGLGSLNARVRPVLCWQIVIPSQYVEQLEWIKATYGAPSKFLYGIAGAPYFNTEGTGPNASVDQLIETMRRHSDESAQRFRKPLIETARRYGLKAMCYEGGPDSGGGSTANIANRIRAMRDPRMKELVTRDLADNWYALGGDLFMYFTLSSGVSRYGMWGATEDITRLDSPKMQALKGILGVK
ncbi:MAG: hypothetical protein HZC36_13715 [Armatimonadetes bacterium]|nr:hypothetical protein [Armatimonadota bacterium]